MLAAGEFKFEGILAIKIDFSLGLIFFMPRASSSLFMRPTSSSSLGFEGIMPAAPATLFVVVLILV